MNADAPRLEDVKPRFGVGGGRYFRNCYDWDEV
jgi:hypothetical protein